MVARFVSHIAEIHLIFWQNVKLDTASVSAQNRASNRVHQFSMHFPFISIKYFDVNEMGNGFGQQMK